MTAVTLETIFRRKGLQQARKELLKSFEQDKVTPDEFVNLSHFLGQLVGGYTDNMVCDITKKQSKPKRQ